MITLLQFMIVLCALCAVLSAFYLASSLIGRIGSRKVRILAALIVLAAVAVPLVGLLMDKFEEIGGGGWWYIVLS